MTRLTAITDPAMAAMVTVDMATVDMATATTVPTPVAMSLTPDMDIGALTMVRASTGAAGSRPRSKQSSFEAEIALHPRGEWDNALLPVSTRSAQLAQSRAAPAAAHPVARHVSPSAASPLTSVSHACC